MGDVGDIKSEWATSCGQRVTGANQGSKLRPKLIISKLDLRCSWKAKGHLEDLLNLVK